MNDKNNKIAKKKQELQAELEKLNRKESKAACLKRLAAEIQNAKIKISAAVAVEFRRDAYGLTASEMARILGVSKSLYSEFSNGKRELPKKAMIRAIVIGVPPLAFAECLYEKSLDK